MSDIKTNKVSTTKETKKQKKSIGKKIAITLGAFTLTGIITVGAVGGYIYYSNRDDIKKCISKGYDIVASVNDNTFNTRSTTQILDSNGSLVKEFKLTDYVYSSYDSINPLVFEAFMAIEDQRFYEHNGIDYKGLARAGAKIILSKGEVIQGGSTITQQLVKNVFLTMDQTVWRKLEEMTIAQEIEKMYSKEQILEFYVNNINYGNGCYSIESASEYYYQKNTKDLTLSEVATLVAIPNSPTYYDPSSNPENNKTRRNLILDNMYEQGYITEAERDDAKNTDITLNVKKVNIDNSVNGYDLEFAVDNAVEELMKLNGFQFKYSFSSDEDKNTYSSKYDEAYQEAREELISGGYLIETSINPEIQNKLQEIVDTTMSEFTEINPANGLYMKQTASTVIDNNTGEVVAIVGGRTQDGNTYNRANYGYRQPGSAIKPLVSYTPYFERDTSPDDNYIDSAITNGPANWYSGYKGKVTLRYAVEQSINTIPYRLTSEIGVDNALNYLTNMHFKGIESSDNTPIIAVGGFTKGTTTTEMASAYSTLSRNGKFISPTNVRKITNRLNNTVIYENTHKATQVYEEGASYLMTDTLKGVMNNSNATGYKARIDNYTNQAGKTGSTDDYKDTWMCGYTSYYSMATWVGDDTPKAQYGNAMGNTSKNIWKKMMNYLHQGLEDKSFEVPESVYTDSDGKLRTTMSQKDKAQQKRIDTENERKLNEQKEQQKRLNEEEYRIVYGLSEDEENIREIIAKNKINSLKEYKVTSILQESEIKSLIQEAKTSLDAVKRKSKYNELYSIYNSAVNRLTSDLDNLYQKKYDEEIKAKEEERQREEAESMINEDESNNQEEDIDEQEQEEIESNTTSSDNKSFIE